MEIVWADAAAPKAHVAKASVKNARAATEKARRGEGLGRFRFPEGEVGALSGRLEARKCGVFIRM